MGLVEWKKGESHFKHDLVPVKAQRKKAKSARMAPDRKGSQLVRKRSTGICEACGEQPAVHVHHRLSGNGVRGRGPSALPEHKDHLCLGCHRKAHHQ